MADVTLPQGAAAETAGGPSPRSDEEVSKLKDLHASLVDTREGCDKMVEKAEADFVAVAADFRSLHQLQAERVRAILSAMGEDPGAEGGTVMGSVNRAVVEVRSWFDDIGHNVVEALADGEKRLLQDFEAAIAASPSVERRGMLDRMRGEIVTLLQRHAPGTL